MEIVKFEKGSKLTTIEGGANIIDTYKYDYGTFYNCTALKAIEIPASVETIKATAFKNCSNLTSVKFEPGSKLKTIDGIKNRNGFGAFSNCSSLASIEFPANVETINEGTFSGCTNLQEINFQKGSLLNTIGNSAFYNCATMHYFYATNCTVLKEIGAYAFVGNGQIWFFEIGASTPPACGYYAYDSVFDSVGTYSVLKVPAGTTSAYSTAKGWKDFSSISEIGK